MLRARNGAGNRIAPRGGEFPFFPPRGPNAARVSACHRFPRFAGVGVARHTRSGSIATGRCFASVPFHMYTVGRAGSCIPFVIAGQGVLEILFACETGRPCWSLEGGWRGVPSGGCAAAGVCALCVPAQQTAEVRGARSLRRSPLSF